MGSTRKAIRIGLLFGGMAVSLASVPMMLSKIDSVRSGGAMGAVGGASASDLDLESIVPAAITANGGAPTSRELLEARHGKRPGPKPVTRVLGPDD